MLDEIDLKVREMYLSGIGLPGVSRAIGRSQCFVSGRLKKAGVVLRKPGNPDKQRPYRSADAELLDAAISRYIRGESATSIELDSGVSRPTILSVARARGIKIRFQATGTDEEIIAAYRSGMSVNKIEDYIGCTKRRASNVLKAAGVAFRERTREKTAASRTAACKRRNDALAKATPPWADKQAIKAIYSECRDRAKQTGKKHHVDHFYPLRGELVCGLHTPANLAILTERQNIAKKNKVDPTDLEWVYVN